MMNMRRGGDKMSKKYDELLHTLCIYDSVEKVPYEGCIFLKDGKIANVEKGSIKKEYLEKADTVTECGDKTVCASSTMGISIQPFSFSTPVISTN